MITKKTKGISKTEEHMKNTWQKMIRNQDTSSLSDKHTIPLRLILAMTSVFKGLRKGMIMVELVPVFEVTIMGS